MGPVQYINEPLQYSAPQFFDGRRSLMDHQNKLNMEAEERARINAQNDQLYQMQLGKQEEQRKFDLVQSRIQAETDKDRTAAEEYMKAPTKEGFVKLSINRPNVVQAIKPILDSMDANEKTTAFTTMIKASTALDNKQPEIAERVLDEAKAAYGNAGNQKQVKLIDDLKEQMKANPANAKALFTMYSTALSPEFGAMQSEQLKQQQGQAKTELENKKINSEIKKLDAEAADALAKANGALDPVKKAELEFKTRKEYSDQTQVFKGTKDAYSRMEAAEDSAQGDLSLIFSYMKMLDPGSTVREGEFANAQNAAGIDTKIVNMYNNLRTGERLSEGQRKGFKGQAKKLYTAAKNEEQIVRKGIDRIAKNYGLNPDNIFYEDVVTDPKAMTPNKLSVMAPDGKEYSFESPEKLEAFKKAAGIK